MATLTGTFSLVTIDDLSPVVENKPLGDSAINLKLASGTAKTAAHLSGSLPIDFTSHVGSRFSVQALNGKSGPDEDGVVAAADVGTPAGTFAPPLRFDKADGWLKYVAEADVKAELTASPGIVSFTGSAGTQVSMADYRRHPLSDGLRSAITSDLAGLRSAVVLDHVQKLPAGDALIFQTSGELKTSLDIEWSDVFTSEISGLTRLLKTVAPVAVKTTVGATCSVDVSVTDSFIVVFARPVGGPLRVAVHKGNVRKVDASGGAKISAAIANPKAVEGVLNDVVAGLLGTQPDRLDALLKHLAAGALAGEDNALAAVVVERLKLTSVSEIATAVANLVADAQDKIKTIVESKVEASFTYEYHRVRTDVALFEAEIPDGGPTATLHQELIGGDLRAAFAHKTTDIAVKRFLNERTTTMTRAWGFTLGLNKWKLFGKDRRELDAVERVDVVAGTLSRSYVGSGGYARNKLSWSVDFVADMANGRPRPNVSDYQFGLHVAVVRDEQLFTADDLETALDFAALWSICPENSLPLVRQQLAPAVNNKAEWSFHLRVNDEALRPIFRVFGSMTPRDFAGAAAAALDATRVASVEQRRSTYLGLWRAVLESAEAFTIDTVRRSADSLLQDRDLARKERNAIDLQLFDQSTVATVVAFDTKWFADCGAFSRGCRLLADAISTPTPDNGKVPDVYDKIVKFWTQSHYVRTLGAALIDAARNVGQFRGIERTLNLKAGTTAIVISSNQF